jgi:hypothetical protein
MLRYIFEQRRSVYEYYEIRNMRHLGSSNRKCWNLVVTTLTALLRPSSRSVSSKKQYVIGDREWSSICYVLGLLRLGEKWAPCKKCYCRSMKYVGEVCIGKQANNLILWHQLYLIIKGNMCSYVCEEKGMVRKIIWWQRENKLDYFLGDLPFSSKTNIQLFGYRVIF